MAQGEISSVKSAKMALGIDFLKKLGPGLIKFAGIVGSVSYEPSPGDDVDIFVISRDGRLWITIIYIFLMKRIRRVPDICPSLFMSNSYALNFFREQRDPLISMDAVRAHVVFGAKYYRSLLGESSYIRERFPHLNMEGCDSIGRRNSIPILEILIFPIAASFLKLKEIIQNRKFQRCGDTHRMFRTVLSTGCMYLDTEKYRRLREEAMRDETEQRGNNLLLQ